MECALAHSCARRSCSTKKAPTPNRNESLYSLNHLYDILTYAFPVTEENPAQLTRHPASLLTCISYLAQCQNMSACQPATQERSSHPCYSYRLTPAADSLKLSYGATVSVFVFIHYVIIVQRLWSVNL